MKKILLVLSGFLAANLAHGYFLLRNNSGQPLRWHSTPVTMKVMLGTPPISDGSDFVASYQTAIQTWNTLIGSIQLQPEVASPPASFGMANYGDGINQVVFSSKMYDKYAFGTGVLAVTFTLEDDTGTERAEADMIFNTAYFW